MNVASLELCKELYELSGWETGYWHCTRCEKVFDETILSNHELKKLCPAYDSGYLLRKLPVDCPVIKLRGDLGYRTFASNIGNNPDFIANTPEDALCKLAIELFKQKVLKR